MILGLTCPQICFCWSKRHIFASRFLPAIRCIRWGVINQSRNSIIQLEEFKTLIIEDEVSFSPVFIFGVVSSSLGSNSIMKLSKTFETTVIFVRVQNIGPQSIPARARTKFNFSVQKAMKIKIVVCYRSCWDSASVISQISQSCSCFHSSHESWSQSSLCRDSSRVNQTRGLGLEQVDLILFIHTGPPQRAQQQCRVHESEEHHSRQQENPHQTAGGPGGSGLCDSACEFPPSMASSL